MKKNMDAFSFHSLTVITASILDIVSQNLNNSQVNISIDLSASLTIYSMSLNRIIFSF